MYDIESLSAVDCGAAVNFLKRLARPHKDGRGLFAEHPAGPGEVLGYYYELLVYFDLGGNKHLKEKYD